MLKRTACFCFFFLAVLPSVSAVLYFPIINPHTGRPDYVTVPTKIGTAISGASPYEIFFSSADGTLRQEGGLYYDPSGSAFIEPLGQGGLAINSGTACLFGTSSTLQPTPQLCVGDNTFSVIDGLTESIFFNSSGMTFTSPNGITFSVNPIFPAIGTGKTIAGFTSGKQLTYTSITYHDSDNHLAINGTPGSAWLTIGGDLQVNGNLFVTGSTGTLKALNGQVAGYSMATTTMNYTLAALSNHYLKVDASSQSVTVTLPTAVGISTFDFEIKKVDSSTNTITIATTASQTIDGYSSWTIRLVNDVLRVVSDNSNWSIFP